MNRISGILLILLVGLSISCSHHSNRPLNADDDSVFHYAEHITFEHHDGYTLVRLVDPWKKGHILHTYALVTHDDSTRMSGRLPAATVVYVPLRRVVVFTAAHANLSEMLGAGKSIAGVADPQYMHIPDIQRRLNNGNIYNVGNSMRPDIEKIVSLHADAVFLSPFENSGGYGRLEEINIPIIECADYMEAGALARAEWMKFYGLLFGKENAADSLFAVVERNYHSLLNQAKSMKGGRSVLPDRKTGSVWYVPGGKSSVGLLYRDAKGSYAFSGDNHTGSLALPFETVLDKMGEADFWILSYNGTMSRARLLAEYRGYSALKPMRTGEIYGCAVDATPYFEEVSWRPDWLLSDLIKLFHPSELKGTLRYYHKLPAK